jgi:hypothetical protein
MLAGGLGYILQINLLVFLTLNFGMGGALLAVFIAAMKLFKAQEKTRLQ